MLTSPPCLAGDYNRDGSVDAADYVVWRVTFGQSREGLAADGDGEIDAGDYTVWTTNFGADCSTGAGAGLAAIPEPVGSLLLLIGSAGLAGSLGRSLRRRRFHCFRNPDAAGFALPQPPIAAEATKLVTGGYTTMLTKSYRQPCFLWRDSHTLLRAPTTEAVDCRIEPGILALIAG